MMDKNLVFGIKEGEDIIYLTLAKKRINVPPFGALTAEEVVKREDVLRHLVEHRKTFPVLRALTDEELAEYESGLEKQSKEIPPAPAKTAEELEAEAAALAAAAAKKAEEDQKAAEQAKKDLEAAQAEYQTLTGKKPGTMKLDTLLKKIEAAKAVSPKTETE